MPDALESTLDSTSAANTDNSDTEDLTARELLKILDERITEQQQDDFWESYAVDTRLRTLEQSVFRTEKKINILLTLTTACLCTNLLLFLTSALQ